MTQRNSSLSEPQLPLFSPLRLVEKFYLWARYSDTTLKVSHEVGQVRRSHAHEIAYVGRQQENGSCNSSLSSATGPRPPAMVHGQPAHGRLAHGTASSGLNRTRTAATAAAAWKQPTGVSSKGRAPAFLQRSSGVITSCTRKPVQLEPLFEDDRVCVNILVCSCLELSGLVLE